MSIINELKTGDLILFHSDEKGPLGILNYIIEFFTHSQFNHIGMILKNPTYIKPQLEGIFVWESSVEPKPDPQDNKYKLGVQITPLDEILKSNKGNAYLRKIKCSNELYNSTFTEENIKNIHKMVYDKPYDINPRDWIEALFRKDNHPQKTDRFWCSALVGYIYTKLGILKNTTDWSILRPSDFSIESHDKYINFNDGFELDDKQVKI